MARVVYGLVILLACIPMAWGQQQAIRLKVLTYNIHYGVGMDGKKDLERIARVIRRADPDIVGLQEVHDSAMTAVLGKLTGMEYVFGASTEIEPPNLYRLLDIPVPVSQLYYGDAILSKYPFEYVGNLSIPSASSSRYEAMCVDVDLTGKYGEGTSIRFITTHFDYLGTLGSEAARMASVDVIDQAFIRGNPGRPCILTGDLNATPGSEPLLYLEKKGWVNENMGRELLTVPVKSPRKQIDYILIRPLSRWIVRDVRVIEEKLASDHLPVLMTLELMVD